jgi:AcrR family transcriptional regulator
VIRVATDLLAELGDTGALTMRAVAAAAGVTAPSVYRHFPDKQALVRAVITRRFEEFTSMLRAAADAAAADAPAAASAGEQPMARLEAMARAYVRSGLEHPGHYRVLFSATNAGPAGLGLHGETEHPGAASYRMLVEAVAACLPARRRAAALPLATELWASLHGIVDLRITKPELPWPDPGVLADAALAAVRSATATAAVSATSLGENGV